MKFETLVFGNGCFWCTEAIFKSLKGVHSVTPGYTGGTTTNPSYYDVAEGETGHAEVIQIEFDPEEITYAELFDVFFHTHDPTSLNKQGADVGTQYRSIILYSSEEQKKAALNAIHEYQNDFDKKIVTEVSPLDTFYESETYHRNYYERNSHNPYCQIVISPKLEHFKKRFKYLVKKQT